MSQSVTQRALRNGTRRAVDGPFCPVSSKEERAEAARRVQEAKNSLAKAARKKAAAAIVGTPGGAGGRTVRTVETMQAGLVREQVDEVHALDWCEKFGDLDSRQLEAVWTLQGYYAKAKSPNRITGGYGSRLGACGREMTDGEAWAWGKYCALLAEAPSHTRHALALLATSEYPVMCGARGLMREGADALADHLRLAHGEREKKT